MNEKCNLEYFEFTTYEKECTDLINEFDDTIAQVNRYDFLGKCYTSSKFQLFTNPDKPVFR